MFCPILQGPFSRLNDTETVDPEILDAQTPGHFNGVQKNFEAVQRVNIRSEVALYFQR
jgi:hypothetical protein